MEFGIEFRVGLVEFEAVGVFQSCVVPAVFQVEVKNLSCQVSEVGSVVNVAGGEQEFFISHFRYFYSVLWVGFAYFEKSAQDWYLPAWL